MARRSGFTLVELVVVIMILGIISAIAVPKVTATTSNATDNGLKHSLSIIRDALDRYALEHKGELPGKDGAEATFKSDLAPYLRGQFPACPVGAKNAQIKITTTAGGLGITGEASPTQGWHYHNKAGLFIANTTDVSNDGSTPYDQF